MAADLFVLPVNPFLDLRPLLSESVSISADLLKETEFHSCYLLHVEIDIIFTGILSYVPDWRTFSPTTIRSRQ
jgi:hypothetical protein